jgi:hypothetical protein
VLYIVTLYIYIKRTHKALTFENLLQVHLGRRRDAFLGRNSEKSVYAERGRAARRCQEDEKAQSDFIITAQIFIITAQIPVWLYYYCTKGHSDFIITAQMY